MNENIPHTNPAYDREMKKMARRLGEMESALRAQLADIEAAFAEMNLERAQTVSRNDSKLNTMEVRSLQQAVAVLACYQPVAEDLRRVVGAIHTAAEYERIGDYIKNTARSVESFVSHGDDLKIFPALLSLTREVRRQFEEYLRARADDDLEGARAVWEGDKIIDAAFREAARAAAENQIAGDGNAHSLVQAISVASNLERLGDRVKNLVEIFHYQKTGRQFQSNSEE